MRDLVNVESSPFEVLSKGITWDWETFPSTWMRGATQAIGEPRFFCAADAFRH